MRKNRKIPLLAKNSIFNMIYSVLTLLFPLITTMYASRVLHPTGIGQIAYAQNITSYFLVFSAMGLPTYGVREIARIRENRYKKNKLFTELLIISWILTAIASLLFLSFVWKLRSTIDYKLFLCCGLQLFLNFINIDWMYRGLEEYVFIICRSVVIKVLSIMAMFIFVKKPSDYIIYALITSVALAGNYIFNIIHVRKYVKLYFKDLNFIQHIKPLIILGVAVLFSSIYSKIDITMLGTITTECETGLYSNAFKLVEIATMMGISLTAVFLPRLSYYYQHEKEKFFKTLDLGINALSFFVFPIAIAVFTLAPCGVRLVFGDLFIDSVSTIRILSILIIIKGFGDLLCYQLSIATGNEKKRLPAYAIAALLNIVLNYLLIPVWGRNGAAIASVFSEGLLNLVQFFVMRNIIGYTFSIRTIFKSLVSSVIMAIPILFILTTDLNLIIQGMLSVIVGFCVYVLFNYLFKNQFLVTILKRIKK